MGEQPRQLVEAPQFDHLLALAERFEELIRGIRWVRPYFDEVPLSDLQFEAVVAVMAMATGAGLASPVAFASRPVPVPVSAGFTKLWTSGVICQPDVTAPHVASAYLSGLWAPKGCQLARMAWEPAGLLLRAMACKLVSHGLHELVRLGLEPLAAERRNKRSVFNLRAVQAAHAVVAALGTAQGDRTLAEWDCQAIGLWAFLADAILGPGRRRTKGCPGDRTELAKRPQPGASHKCHLGRWMRDELGITAGTCEIYVCASCLGEHAEPQCRDDGDTLVIATYREHMFVTRRNRLTDPLSETGSVQVKRSVCKNEACVERLRAIWTTSQGAQPIYTLGRQPCPYCGASGRAGQRPVTVWTRFP